MLGVYSGASAVERDADATALLPCSMLPAQGASAE